MLPDEWSAAEARGGRDGRQEGGERGYYDLHHKLNDVFLFHKNKLKELRIKN